MIIDAVFNNKCVCVDIIYTDTTENWGKETN